MVKLFKRLNWKKLYIYTWQHIILTIVIFIFCHFIGHCQWVVAAGLVPNTFPYTPDFFIKMTSKLQEYKDTIERSLNDKNSPWAKYFEVAEKKTGVNRVYIFIGKFPFFSIMSLFISLAIIWRLFCRRIGRVHRFIFSVWIRRGVDMQFYRIRLPSVYVNEGIRIACERRWYKVAYILGSICLLLNRRVLFRFYRWLVPVILVDKG